MKISAQILSIPPYLSTSWKNVSSIHANPDGEKFKLIVILHNGIQVVIPSLDQATVDRIFDAHVRYSSLSEMPQLPPNSISIPIGANNEEGGGVDMLNSTSQHNPALANSPEMSKELLEKITGIAKVLGLGDPAQFPKPEPHCNCPFCQIARAFHGGENGEEEVSDKDLTFRTWDIQQTGEKLYNVTNPLDEKERYSVFLGDPLGCTCGQKNCEHIRAVLKS